MAHKVIVPQKKIMSRSFLNSGTLIVIYLESSPMPEFIDPRFRENKHKTLVFSH